MQLPKLPRHGHETLSAQEIDKLEAGARSVRDARIVRLLGDTGMRRHELVELTTRDLLNEGGQERLLVHGIALRRS